MNNPITNYELVDWYFTLFLFALILGLLGSLLFKTLISNRKKKGKVEKGAYPDRLGLSIFIGYILAMVILAWFTLTVALPYPSNTVMDDGKQLFMKNLALAPYQVEEVKSVKFLSDAEKEKYLQFQPYYLTEKREGETDFVQIEFQEANVLDDFFPKVELIHVYMVYEDVGKAKIRYQSYENGYYNTTLILPLDAKDRLNTANSSN